MGILPNYMAYEARSSNSEFIGALSDFNVELTPQFQQINTYFFIISLIPTI